MQTSDVTYDHGKGDDLLANDLPSKGAGQSRWQGIAFAALLLAAPSFAGDFWLSVFMMPWLILSLAGIGLNITTGYAGLLSIGAGGFMAVGAYGMYAFAVHGGIENFLVILLLGGLATAIVGFLVGIPSTRIGGFYVIVTTLAAQFFLVWLFGDVPWFYNYSPVPTIALPPTVQLFGLNLTNDPIVSYYFVVVTVIALTWVAKNLVESPIGRNWIAVRDMNIAAQVIGIKVNSSKILAFAIGGFYLGIAGALWAFLFLQNGSPEGFGLDKSFQVLFLIIIGGMGTIRGNFIGAAFVLLLPIVITAASSWIFGNSEFQGLLSNTDNVIFGALIVLILIKEPEGFDKLIRNLSTKIQR